MVARTAAIRLFAPPDRLAEKFDLDPSHRPQHNQARAIETPIPEPQR
jgi:hypothetical protein